MQMFMYKVYYTEKGEIKTALFETEHGAITFYDYLTSRGVTATINKWTWKVEIED